MISILLLQRRILFLMGMGMAVISLLMSEKQINYLIIRELLDFSRTLRTWQYIFVFHKNYYIFIVETSIRILIKILNHGVSLRIYFFHMKIIAK